MGNELSIPPHVIDSEPVLVFNTLTKKYAILSSSLDFELMQMRCGRNYAVYGSGNIESALALMTGYTETDDITMRLINGVPKNVYVCGRLT